MSSSTDAVETDTVEEVFESVRFAPGGEDRRVARPRSDGRGALPWQEIVVGPPEEEPAPAPAAAPAGVVPAAETVPLLFDEDEVARICAAVTRRAERRVRELAARREAELRNAALTRFEARLDELAGSGDTVWRQLRAQLAEVIRSFAEAAVPSLVQRLGNAEVTAAVTGILDRMGPEDGLEVRVCPELAEDLARLLPRSAGRTGTGTAWRVVADPAMSAGDFRIDRRHGFLERRAEEICARIAEAVGGVLSASERAAEEEDASPAGGRDPSPDSAEE